MSAKHQSLFPNCRRDSTNHDDQDDDNGVEWWRIKSEKQKLYLKWGPNPNFRTTTQKKKKIVSSIEFRLRKHELSPCTKPLLPLSIIRARYHTRKSQASLSLIE